MRFIDEVEFTARSGDGGNGRVGFRREAKVPRGGPNGGDGGRGGAVIFEATTARNTLSDFRRNKLYRAPNGEIGGSSQCTGADGSDLRLLVPVGTVIRHRETEEILADLVAPGDRFELPGGRGGRGNQHFATATRQTPTFAEDGKPGRELPLHLELKLIADVGLLGFPNAGKSTLISRISAARPKVADYPFTTLVPNLGVVDVDVGASFVVADMPGLIVGASEGAGLGHQFLRHVERCALYVHLVAPDAEVPPAARLAQLDAELRAYDPALLERPQIVVLSKVDLLQPDEIAAETAALRACTRHPVLAASAASGEGIKALIRAMWEAVHGRGDAR
jgi:GTP-binding protein